MNTEKHETVFSRIRKGTVGRFAEDRSGVAAVEFAFIAPILFMLYFLTMETSQAIDVNKRVGRVASMVADLVTQQQSLTKTETDAILDIGSSILYPYGRSTPTITITGIEITDEATPKVQVAWSRKSVAGTKSAGEAVGTTTTVPTKLEIKGTFLVRVTTSLGYKPVLTWSSSQKAALEQNNVRVWLNDISMGETYYLRPRMSATVTCSDCNS